MKGNVNGFSWLKTGILEKNLKDVPGLQKACILIKEKKNKSNKTKELLGSLFWPHLVTV